MLCRKQDVEMYECKKRDKVKIEQERWMDGWMERFRGGVVSVDGSVNN